MTSPAVSPAKLGLTSPRATEDLQELSLIDEASLYTLAGAGDPDLALNNAHRLHAALGDGSLLRGEVLARWQDVVGTGEFFRGVETTIGRLRDRLGALVRGRPAPPEEVETALETGLHAVIVDAADTAAARSWSHVGAVAPELRAGADPSLARASADIDERASQLVRDWQAGIIEQIQGTAGEKRQRARVMSFGLNVLTVALILMVFASTAGLSGGEVAIAGGSAVLSQKLLETVFGEDTVRKMATDARNDLNNRLDALLRVERERYFALTDPLIDGAGASELRTAADAARSSVDERFPGILSPAPAALEPAARTGTSADDVMESFERGTLRGLFDQLRGTFGTQGGGE